MRRSGFRVYLIIGVAIIATLVFLYWAPEGKIPLGEVYGDKILIISPHPDDESLGTTGVIARSLSEGHDVKVVLMTCGDGFEKAARVLSGKETPEPEDYLKLGRTRQQETTRAMTLLGLPPMKITFLGYPDSALEDLWENQWDVEKAAGKVNTDHVLYDDAFKTGAPFTGQSVVDTLSDIISEYQPTEIYYPDPLDDHPDHWATSAFVQYTLAAINYNCTEHTYLVHRSLWPQPDLEEPTKPLLPPEDLQNVGTDWSNFTLSENEIALKKLVLKQYPTQEAVMEPFLWAFIRSNELFGSMPTEIINESGAILKDPRADTIRRFLTGSADITGVRFARQGSDLMITIETRAVVSNKITYLLGLRIIDNSSHIYRTDFRIYNGTVDIPLQAANSIKPEIKSFQASGNRLILSIEAPELAHPAKMLAGAQTFQKQNRLDITAWRVFSFKN